MHFLEYSFITSSIHSQSIERSVFITICFLHMFWPMQSSQSSGGGQRMFVDRISAKMDGYGPFVTIQIFSRASQPLPKWPSQKRQKEKNQKLKRITSKFKLQYVICISLGAWGIRRSLWWDFARNYQQGCLSSHYWASSSICAVGLLGGVINELGSCAPMKC